MFEAKITIETPSLSQALNRLADAMTRHTVQPVPAAPPTAPATVQTTPPAAPVAPPPAAPVAPVAPVAPANPIPPVSTVPPAPAAPLAPAPSFTLEQIGKAGADLLRDNPNKYPELMALLGQFGISVVDQLKPEQYGPFATALRGLGAKI